ncbi:MAG: pyridoxal phosphate-dependent aminotransferase [Ligilactobacillus animalis]|uniref:pyridoxal phosphate-dependent aminotransferase n=1 Tax=Ligilactobacillus animalis TaxID=1605 RepID=UPI0037FF041D
MQARFNHKIEAIAVSDIRQFDMEVSQIEGIIKLTLGEPDFNTPEHVKQAAVAAINADQSHYTPNSGIMELRRAAAKYYKEKYDLDYTPEQVITTVGATEAIAASLQTILNPGDTVLMPTPVFPIYAPISQLNGADVLQVDTSADGFILTPEKLRATLEENKDKNIKAVVLVYPSNPTGATYTKEQLAALAKVIAEYDIWALCDEVYAELTYEGQHVSLASFLPENTIVIGGLSKSHAMTGWRLGFILGPKDFSEQVVKAHQYMVTAPTTNVQFAALEALTKGKDDALSMRKEYRARRDFMRQALEDAGFEVVQPDGAFYLFAKIPTKCGHDSWKFVRELAKEAKVALIPGVSFGQGGEGYVRLSYAASMDDLHQASERIKKFTDNY